MTVEMIAAVGGIVLLILLMGLAVLVERTGEDAPSWFTVAVGAVVVFAILALFSKAGF